MKQTFLKLVLLLPVFLNSCMVIPRIKVIKNLEYSRYQSQQTENPLFLDLYIPESKANQTFPLLIYIHGGGWLEGSKENCPAEQVAKRNYVLACINYRLSTEALFPAQIHDVKKAVRWLRKNAKIYHINPDKIGVWGDSAGGHLSALLGTSSGVAALEDNSEISSNVQAVCVWYAPTDFTLVPPAFTDEVMTEKVLQDNQNKPWFAYTLATHQLLGGNVKDKLDLAQLANPITHIDADDPPFLIVHGERDTVVPIHQSEILAEALTTKGISVTFIRLPQLTHSYRGKNGEPFDPELIKITIDFFDQHLKIPTSY